MNANSPFKQTLHLKSMNSYLRFVAWGHKKPKFWKTCQQYNKKNFIKTNKQLIKSSLFLNKYCSNLV